MIISIVMFFQAAVVLTLLMTLLVPHMSLGAAPPQLSRKQAGAYKGGQKKLQLKSENERPSRASRGEFNNLSFNMPTPTTNICLNHYVMAPGQYDAVHVNFVHVFKTGGSSLRNLMRDYSKLCAYSLGILINCDLKSHSMERIANGSNNSSLNNINSSNNISTILSCTLKEAHTGFHSVAGLGKVASDGVLSKWSFESFSRFNVVAGHFNIRILNLIAKHYGNSKNIAFTWIRDPLNMLISSSTFLIEKTTTKTSIESIVKKMLSKLKNPSMRQHGGVYSQYMNYYADYALVDAGLSNQTTLLNVVKANIEKFNMIGVIENHNTSIKMLQATLDPKNSLVPSFWSDALKYERNKSELVDAGSGKAITKGDIISYLKDNPSNMTYIMDQLRTEYIIYHHGLNLHNRQCKALQAEFANIMSEVNCNAKSVNI